MRLKTSLQFFLVAIVAAISGCNSLDQRQLDQAADLAVGHAEQAEVQLRSGQYRAAIASWRAAVSSLRPGSHDYSLGKLYLAHSRFESSIGWAHLLADEPQLAGQAYRDSIETIRDGARAHKAILQDNKETAEMFVNLAQAATYGAATYAQARTASYAAAQGRYFTPTQIPIPDWVTLPEPSVRLPGAKLLKGGLHNHVVRIPVVPDRGPLKRVGRVRSPGSYCTGSLVGPRIVMTNAHCVVRDKNPNAPLRPSELSFHLEKVRSTVSFPVRTFYTHRGEGAGYSSQRAGSSVERFGNDWALLVIDVPPGMRLGYLALDGGLAVDSTWPPGDKLVLAGCSGDLNSGTFMTMHWGCEPLKISAVVTYNCSSNRGSSGSPVFRVSGRQWRVVALNACAVTSLSAAREGIACGPHIRRIMSEIARLRRAYPYA